MLDEKVDIVINKISFDLFFSFETKKFLQVYLHRIPERRERERSRFKLTLSSTPDRLAPIV